MPGRSYSSRRSPARPLLRADRPRGGSRRPPGERRRPGACQRGPRTAPPVTSSPGTRSTRARPPRDPAGLLPAWLRRAFDPGASCGSYDGPPLAGCSPLQAPDGSYRALQRWQRLKPNYGGKNAGWGAPPLPLVGPCPCSRSGRTGRTAASTTSTGATATRVGRCTASGDAAGKPARRLRPQLYLDTRTRGTGRLAAGEQLLAQRPNGASATASTRTAAGRRQGDAVPGDRDRPRRHSRRDVEVDALGSFNQRELQANATSGSSSRAAPATLLGWVYSPSPPGATPLRQPS